MRVDVIVAGAGIVGVSIALHLQARGRSVAIVDRTGVAAETSYGNAGLIERSSIIPYAFPRELGLLIRYGLNNRSDARFDWTFLPKLAPWLFAYWRQSSKANLQKAAAAMLPLIENCVIEHDRLIADAGATPLISRNGWLEVYRSEAKLGEAIAEVESLKSYGLDTGIVDRSGIAALEPNLTGPLKGGVHWRDPLSVSDPGALVKSYADLFTGRGGVILTGDAQTLRADGDEWQIAVDAGKVTARDAVVALGPWSDVVFKPLGYRIPLAVKRGYHMHFKPEGNARLARPILDGDAGYVLAPMAKGLRLTTGVEFADREAPKSWVPLSRTEPFAREIFPLGERVEDEPWLGRRPALPDMRPVIGPAPRHKGLWFAFGHAHHGLTLGPVTGRLLAELITGETPFTDPAPYRADRFS